MKHNFKKGKELIKQDVEEMLDIAKDMNDRLQKLNQHLLNMEEKK